MNFKNAEKVVRIATIGIVVYLLCFGIAMAFFPIRPFWNDEWRLIYNLKFKNEDQLWGTLDLLQQCPRVFLTALKKITSFFDYSYTSMRLPALVIGTASAFLCFYLKKKIFPGRSVYSNLFVLILISSSTFTDYLVQIKQYEMDIFLCLVTLWQLLTLLETGEGKPVGNLKYLLLCFSFLVAPYFSYIYPIAVAPIFPMALFMSFNKKNGKFLLRLYLPLILAAGSIIVFYFIDVKQLMNDNSMYLSYRRMLGRDRDEGHAIENFWKFFALVGSGLIFEIIFGILGIAATIYGAYRLARVKMQDYTQKDYFEWYAVLLLVMTLCFIFSGKLMGGVARLTAFTVPSIAMLVVSLLEDIKVRYAKVANTIVGILFLALFGNIASTCINTFTYPEYKNRIATYRNTEKALEQARLAKIPIMYTDGVRGDKIEDNSTAPGKISANMITPEQIAGADTLCAEVVLKVNPGYKVWDPVLVYWMPGTRWTAEYMTQLPGGITSAIIGDGINFRQMNRPK